LSEPRIIEVRNASRIERPSADSIASTIPRTRDPIDDPVLATAHRNANKDITDSEHVSAKPLMHRI
jgi:hypothetical protein